eukprot:gene3378-5925_t
MKIIFFTIVLVSAVFAKDWYISQLRGDDNNSGTKLNPLLTFQKAYASLKDGDTVKVEIGVYNLGITEVSKSFKISGISESGVTPLFAGFLSSKSKDIQISGLNWESKTHLAFYSVGADSVKITDVKFEPASSEAIKIEDAKSKIEISKVMMTNTKGVSITGKTPSVIITDIQIRNAFQGLLVRNVGNLKIKNVVLHSIKNCQRLPCGLTIDDVNDFTIQSTLIQDSEYAYTVRKSKGVIEDSKANNINSRSNGKLGGGFYVSSSSEVRTKNFDLINCAATTGGGFYCGTATLNMVGGKIHKNKATSGGAGQCDRNNCAFFAVGTDFKDNTQTSPSNCRGVPNSLKKI